MHNLNMSLSVTRSASGDAPRSPAGQYLSRTSLASCTSSSPTTSLSLPRKSRGAQVSQSLKKDKIGPTSKKAKIGFTLKIEKAGFPVPI